MLEEEKFKKRFIRKLNAYNTGWRDGDSEIGKESLPTADIVHNQLKIAIEIKDDTKYKIELPSIPGLMSVKGYDLKK